MPRKRDKSMLHPQIKIDAVRSEDGTAWFRVDYENQGIRVIQDIPVDRKQMEYLVVRWLVNCNPTLCRQIFAYLIGEAKNWGVFELESEVEHATTNTGG